MIINMIKAYNIYRLSLISNRSVYVQYIYLEFMKIENVQYFPLIKNKNKITKNKIYSMVHRALIIFNNI